MTVEPEIVSVEQLKMENGRPIKNSIKQRVFCLLNIFPYLTPKSICRKLGLPYPKYHEYVRVLRSKWKRNPDMRGCVSILDANVIAAPKMNQVIKRVCRNCGWKLGSKPVIVELYGIVRVDRKKMVHKKKWCVLCSEKPPEGVCGEWIEKT